MKTQNVTWSHMSRLIRMAVLGTAFWCFSFAPALADTWTSAVTPTQTEEFNNSGTLELTISTSQAVSNPAGCSASDTYLTTDPLIMNATLAVAVAALASGSQIALLISNTQCVLGRPTITGIRAL